MERLFDALTRRLGALWRPQSRPASDRAYRCTCGRPVFFRNSRCLACGTELGFDPDRGRVVALRAAEGGDWTAAGETPPTRLRRCANFESAAGCNWMIGKADREALCRSCRLTRTVSDLSSPANAQDWRVVEVAKRRLVSQLIALGLPVERRSDARPNGVEFDFLRSPPGGPSVMTGHAGGLITLNLEEADDARREQIRAAMREPYRTLLGHFRHEIAHYYWDRLVRDTEWLAPFRATFGDERASYADALQRHYEQGPPADWHLRMVSAYASMHPWEDWAETWAHYLHMVDTLDTAMSFGLEADDLDAGTEPFGADVLPDPQVPGAERFLGFVNAWVELTAVLNELSRAMGLRDFYPFVLARPVVAKLHLVHRVIEAAAAEQAGLD